MLGTVPSLLREPGRPGERARLDQAVVARKVLQAEDLRR